SIHTEAVGINPAGQIVGLYQSADTTFHAFLLSQGSFTSIDFPGATSTLAPTGVIGINPAGDKIVGYYTAADTAFHAFQLSQDTFTFFDFPGAISSCAFGINPAGDIVGLYCDTPGGCASGLFHGFLLSTKK